MIKIAIIITDVIVVVTAMTLHSNKANSVKTTLQQQQHNKQ